MDLYRRWPSLAACLITFHLIIACPHDSLAIDESNVIRLIHPTIHRAFLSEDGSALLETNNLPLIRPNNRTIKHLVKYTGVYVPDVASAAKISSSSTNYYPNTRKSNTRENVEPRQKSIAVVRITYDSEIDTYKKSYALLNMTGFGRGSLCNKHAFRAFDLVRILKVNATIFGNDWAIAVGFIDTHLCLLYYRDYKPTEVRDDPFGSASQVFEHKLLVANKPAFRVASATVADRDISGTRKGVDALVEYYDEAGQVFQFRITTPDMSELFVSEPGLSTSLTAVNLLETGARLDYQDKTTEENLNANRTKVMRQHFDHAFVEAITMSEGGLAYARGLFHEPKVRFINKTDAAWPRGIEGSPELLDTTIVAYETYKRNGSRYHHIIDLKLGQTEGIQHIGGQPNYWYCAVPSGDAEVIWPRESAFCSYMQHETKMTPIDMVYREQCDKVYAFYQHLVQAESADRKMTKDSPYTVLNWMRFPVNAILHHRDRLYLFGPANSLRISEPIGDDCTFEKLLVPDEEYYQSDLLFMFLEASGEAKHPGVPIYDSERYFDGSTWTPALGSQKDLPKEVLLDAPIGEKGISNLTILLLVIAIILVLMAAVYLFLTRRRRPDDKRAEVGPRTSSRQKRSPRSPLATVRSSGPSRIQSGSTAISDTPTIRSSHQVPDVPTLQTVATSFAGREKESSGVENRSLSGLSKSMTSGSNRSSATKISKPVKTPKTPERRKKAGNKR